MNYDKFNDFIGMSLERKYFFKLWYTSDKYRECFLVIIRPKFKEGRFRKRENFKTIGNNYANKNDKRKLEEKSGYYHIATLENL